MCGIAGFIGYSSIEASKIEKTLSLMKNRGPDVQKYEYVSSFPENGNLNVLFLHSRLSIIDLDERSNQPFTIGNCTVVFNGEIYNYVELKEELKRSGITFGTTSDTEVLLQAYLAYGPDCVKKFEGMWSFAIWDRRNQHLLLSRDRFSEKPLYTYQTSDGLYFASEIKALKALSGKRFKVNQKQLLRYLILGYKSLYKQSETFFEEIRELPYASTLQVDARLNSNIVRYWWPKVEPKKMSLAEAIEGSRRHLFESIRIRLRSDVPLAFCLSGGVDSASLVSIAAKQFNCDVATFSIIEADERYNEYNNIMATVRDVGCKHTLIEIPQQEGIGRLKALIEYHDVPVATTTFYVHSLLSESIFQNGYRVAFSGTAADELYTGYYDHFLLHLHEMRGRTGYEDCLKDWQENIARFVRNPILRDPDLYAKNPGFRDHVFDNHREFWDWLTPSASEHFQGAFSEVHFCDSLLRNRMLNELFHEATPVILHEDDLNSMCYSVENRSPYLDSRLCEFMYSVPPEYLIRGGYGKYLLRESVNGILNDQVRLDRQKKGFNASIHSLFDLKNKEVCAQLLDPRNSVFEWVQWDKVAPLFKEDVLPNHYSKFLFSLINAEFFLEQNL
ncbi:MAG: asparagine synthase (glutamine-hydrolyzing) [Gammaproteobacteria bacterium]|nr:asparagine synthase (glutamine-hydrolyzing) [Gammaproteobacteria bacterium]